MQQLALPPEYRPDIPPFEVQRESVEMGWYREYFAYLLEMGLGKTRTLIDDFCLNFILGYVDALLVLAPKSVYSNWTRIDSESPGELQKWLWREVTESAITHQYRAGKATRDARERLAVLDAVAPGARILVVNVEAISSTKEAVEFCEKFLRSHRTMMVIDESTVVKERTSNRTKRITKMGLLATKRRILTGSPITGSPSDAWGQFEFLERGILGHSTFRSFQSRYCLLRDMRVGGRVIQKEVGTQNLDELRDVIAKNSIRRRKKDCLDLPEKVYEPPVEVELTDEQVDAYKEMKRTAMLLIADKEVTTTIVMTQLMRLHQIAIGHVKADDGTVLRLKSKRPDAMLEVIERSGDRKVVIWCNYRDDADIVTETLAEKYGRDAVSRWTGAENTEERELGEARFQNDPKVRFMVSTSAGARGRTWTAGTLVIYYSNSYDLEIREQSEDRTHRIGQTGTVVYVDLISPGTVEGKIVKALRSKKDVSRAIQQDGASQWI